MAPSEIADFILCVAKHIPMRRELKGIQSSTATPATSTVAKHIPMRRELKEGVRDYTLLMDRGFFSTDNIDQMISADLSFIIPPTSTLKNVKETRAAGKKHLL